MIQGKVDRSAFLDACKALSEETMDAIVVAHPAAFKGVVDFGAGVVVAAKPPAKPRERKAAKAGAHDVAVVCNAMRDGANTTQAIMARAGLTDRATRAAVAALIASGEAEQVGKGRGAKYVLKVAA